MLLALVADGHAFASSPLGPPGLTATYRLDADPNRRPDYEKQNRETVVELTLTNGPTATLDDGAYQWFELSFTKRNGQRFKLWILIDRLPGSSSPHVARYVWSEPAWERPLEYVHSKTERALLPKLGLFSRGWPRGVKGRIERESDFPARVHFLGYPFKQTATGNEAPFVVPSAKVLRLNPDLTVFTIDAFRYLAPARHHLGENEQPFTPDKYRKLTADDVREMIRMGVSLMNDHHHTRNVLDVWQEPVFVFDTARPWPEVLYRSNYYGLRWHLNEPAVHHSAKYVNQPDVIATWKPSQVAQSLLSEVEGFMTTWKGYGTWRELENNYGLGDLEKYHQRLMSWDQAPGAIWYQMLGLADGVVKEHAPGADVPYLNMCYQVEIPDTQRNSFALETAALRGAARNFDRRWGVSLYGSHDAAKNIAGLQYAYAAGATDIWFWSGWPNVDADWPHYHKLFFFDQLNKFAERQGPRDLRALHRAAKVAIALPFGYEPGFNGTMFDTWWMHPQRKNERGVLIRQILHNAYQEAERLLRDQIEFDFVIDYRFTKKGYDEIIYILDDGKVRIEQGAEQQFLDGPRSVSRPELGTRPTISATLVEPVIQSGDPVTITVTAAMGSSDIARPTSRHPLDKTSWTFGRVAVETPNGFWRRAGALDVDSTNPTQTSLTTTWRYDKTAIPGKYRVLFSTIDEFSRWAECWVEFTVHASKTLKSNS